MAKVDDFNKSISNFLMVDECLLDARRVAFFERAIDQFVKPGNLVVDGGTGTGIIGLIAARKGARVYAVERDPVIARIAKKNVIANKLTNKIKVVNQDVRLFKLPRGLHADVVIMEMLDTGMVAEQQAQAVIALRKNGVITDKTLLLPGAIECLLSAVHYDFNFYGFAMPLIVQARNFGVINRVHERLSRLEHYATIDLHKITSTVINAQVHIPITRNGTVNAVELKSHIYLGQKRYAETSDMNMPVIVPIPPRRVTKGDILKLRLQYNMGHGFADFKITSL